MRQSVFVLVLVVLLLGAACQPTGPSAADLMPDIAGYTVAEGKDLSDAIGKLADGAALLSGNPELIPVIEAIDGVMQCYQDAGAVSGRIFTKTGDPLASGVIVIIDRNRLTNPQTFLNCLRPQDGPEMSAAAVVEPCGAAYTLQRDNNEYYILYAGTRPEVCKAFCGALEGCTP